MPNQSSTKSNGGYSQISGSSFRVMTEK